MFLLLKNHVNLILILKIITCRYMVFYVILGGFSAAERQLMTKKIEYLSSIGHHPNIVRFVGSYDDRDAG